MIRVLQVVSSLSRGSGVMSFLIKYQRLMGRQGIVFDYLYFKDSSITYREEVEKMGGKVYKIPRPSLTVGFCKSCSSFFAQFGPTYDIMHCHPIYASAVFGPCAKKNGIRVIIQHSHTTKYGGTRLSAARNYIIETLFGRCATHFAACSESAKQIFYWLQADRIRLIPNAIDVEQFRFSPQTRGEIREMLGIADSTLVIGHIGRFAPQKNHQFILNLYWNFEKVCHDSVLLLIGDGNQRDAIRRMAEKLGLKDKIMFVGQVGDPERYYSAMDAFILPSLFEGFGIVAVEAQANGLPCYLSDQVPAEVNISGTCSFLPINEGVGVWSSMLAGRTHVRSSTSARGFSIPDEYDIHVASERLADYYKSLLTT